MRFLLSAIDLDDAVKRLNGLVRRLGLAAKFHELNIPATIVKIIALSQNIDIPDALVQQSLLDTQTLLAQYT